MKSYKLGKQISSKPAKYAEGGVVKGERIPSGLWAEHVDRLERGDDLGADVGRVRDERDENADPGLAGRRILKRAQDFEPIDSNTGPTKRSAARGYLSRTSRSGN